jgi:predicted permease
MRHHDETARTRRARTAGFLLPSFLKPSERKEILSDMEELRLHRIRTGGRLQAFLWFWLEVLRCAVVLRIHRSAFSAGRGGGARGGEAAGAAALLESIGRDLKVALRGFSRTPGVSIVAVATLALGIGATTAIFSFADALLLKPLPVREPSRLVSLFHESTVKSGSFSAFSFPDFQELRDRSEVFSQLAAYSTGHVRLGEGQTAEPVVGMIVSGNYFSALGVGMAAGRGFVPEEDATVGTHPVVVLGFGLWERRFGRDPNLVGGEVTVNGRPFTVVGIASPNTPTLDLKTVPELWVPLMMHEVILPGFGYMPAELFGNRGTHWLSLVGRMEPGVRRAVAQGSLEALAAWQAETYPEENGDWTISVLPAEEAKAGTPGRRPLVQATGLLAVVVGLTLLIACANVANILMARAIARSREMGVRLALGARRLRLVRQVLTEALLLSLVGGTVGLLLATWAMRLIPILGLTSGYPGLQVSLDLRVLAFASGITVLTGTAFGLIPAFRASGEGLARLGRGGNRRAPGRGISARQSLLALQVAFSLVLLIGAGLALRTLWNLRAVPLGFETENMQVAGIDLGDAQRSGEGSYTEAEGRQLYRALLDQTRTLAGVNAVGLARFSPFAPRRMAGDVLATEGGPGGEASRTNVDMNVVSPGYFQAMGIPVLRGRPFTDEDRADAPGVVVVTETTAARLWPGQDPIGQRLREWGREGPGPELEVVGIVADGRYYRSWRSEGRPFLFLPLSQRYADKVSLVIRGRSEGSPAPEALGRLVAELDPGLPALQITPVRSLLDQALGLERTNANVLGLFGLLAILISAIGVYGVVSFSVSQRTHEIGVRVALGARPLDVRRNIVMGCAVPVLVGTVGGWGAALGLGRFARGFLFGVPASDPLTFGATAALLVTVGLAAALLPARRAARVDPVLALQEE